MVYETVATENSCERNEFEKLSFEVILENSEHCDVTQHTVPGGMITLSGLPGTRSEISGPNFWQISLYFSQFHEAQGTENARFSVLTNLNKSRRSVLQSYKC